MIFNMVGGSGGSGATLVVSSPANVSVTVSKDDKSYTKNSGSLGSATFKGLATGTWTVVISNNGQTATKTIEITADYAITIAFFSASINITYPANSTCIVTNAGGQTVASDTNTTSSTKTWTAIVSATGTYTVTATATDGSGNSKSQSVEITNDGQSVSVELSYALVLFDNGDNTGVTGGWEGKGVTPTVSDVLSFSFVNYDTTFAKAASVYAVNKFDLSQYNKLTVVKSEANGWYIGVTENLFSWGVNPPSIGDIGFAAYANLNTSDARIELDISGINTECYVATYQRAASSNPETTPKTFSATLTNITLS